LESLSSQEKGTPDGKIKGRRKNIERLEGGAMYQRERDRGGEKKRGRVQATTATRGR